MTVEKLLEVLEKYEDNQQVYIYDRSKKSVVAEVEEWNIFLDEDSQSVFLGVY